MAKKQQGRGSSQNYNDPLDQFSREEEQLMQLRAQAGANQDATERAAQEARWATPVQGNPTYDPEDKRGMYSDSVAPGQEYGKTSPGAHGGAPEPEDLQKRESEGEEGAGAKDKRNRSASDDETEKVSDKLGSGYTGGEGDDKPKKSRFKFNRKKAAAISLASSTIVSLALGGFSLLHGPLEFLHVGALLEKVHFSSSNNTSDGRVGKLLKYARTRNDPNRRNLGWKGNLVADYYERRLAKAGMIADYFLPDGTKSGSIQRFKIDGNTEEGKRALKKIEALDIDPGRITKNADNIFEIDVNIGGREGTKVTRTILKGTVDAMGFSKVSNWLSNRVLRFRAGVSFHQLKNRGLDQGEDLLTYLRGIYADRDKVITDGVDETDLNNPTNGEDPPQDATPDQQNAASQADEAADQINEATNLDNVAATGERGVAEIADGLKGAVTKGLGAAAVAGFVCAIKGFGDQFGPYLKANIMEPMIRMSMMMLSISSQIKSPVSEHKDVNGAELGAYAKSFYDETSKLDFSAAATWQHETGHPTTGPDIPSSLKPGREKPAFFGVIDAIPGITDACNFLGSKVGTIGLTIAGAVAGGPASVLVDYVSGLAVGKVADKFHLFENLARLIFRGGVTPDAAGPLAGNIWMYGSLLANNDAQIAQGARELSAPEVAQLENENHRILVAEESQKSLYDRYINPENINSMVGSAIMSTPRDPIKMIGSFISAPFQSIGSIFRPAGAQSTTTEYDYGVPRYGFSLDEQDNPIVDDPYANGDIVEPRLAELNQKYGDCFSTTIDPTTGNIQTKDVKLYKEIPDMCKDSGNEELLRYRFYLLDQFTSNSMACYMGDDISCTNGRGENSPVGGPATGTPGTGGGGGIIVGDPYTDSTSVPCAQGTNFIRVDTAYYNGNPFQVNLCGLPNLLDHGVPTEVNSRVSGAWFKLVNDAAAAGVNLYAYSGFRTMAEQQALFNSSDGQGISVATPGYSSHQAGVAIDFGNMSASIAGQTCETRASAPTAEYNWMLANANKYGFKQYSAEAWHWDALNMSNRC